MRFPRSVQTRRTIQSAGQTQRVLACGRFAQRRRAPRRRCAFSARGWRSTGPRKNACTAAPHKIRFKAERTSTACVITCSRESQHEKSLRSLRRPLRWPFDDSGVCPWRRNGLASFLRHRWHSRHWWRLRHEPRRPWDQLVGHRALVKRRGQRPPKGTTARHQSRHQP